MGPLIEADETLAQRSSRGDREAFEELVRRTSRGLFARLYLETADIHKAEDIAQEAYLRAWKSIRSLTEPKAFRAWLFSIAHTALLENIRRRARRKGIESDDRLTAMADRRPGPADATEAREQRERVLALLRSMPKEYRLPLAMRYLAGADYETISNELVLSNGALRGLLSRGMTMLREQMKRTNIE
jgi:RNA polymerase sigma-70 factor, ECF subfamily